MPKTYVLDTNVLLHDPQALYRFEENDLVIPMTVIEEIDRFKKDLSETGRNARHFSRLIDQLRTQGDLVEGVQLETGGCLKVELYTQDHLKSLPPELQNDRGDNRILAVALALRNGNNSPVVFVTKDTNLRIKADVVGLKAEDYSSDKVSIDDLYSGTVDLTVSRESVDAFYEQGFLDIQDELKANQCVTLIDAENPSHTALGRYNRGLQRVLPLVRAPKDGIWGIQPRNREQQFAFDLLLSEDVQFVSLVGLAGTGKTLLAIAAG